MMRFAYLLPLVVLGACQVTEDDQNDQVTLQYNQDVAENAADDIANGAEQAAAAIANGAEEAVDSARNVEVQVDTNKADDKATNSN